MDMKILMPIVSILIPSMKIPDESVNKVTNENILIAPDSAISCLIILVMSLV